MKSPTVVAKEDKKIEPFGAVDRKGKQEDGIIASQYPGWYHDQQVDEMKESVESQKRALKRDAVPPEEVPYVKNRIKIEEQRHREIVDSKPSLDGKGEDFISNLNKNLGEKIRELMFTRCEMKLGLADAHEEARRMKTPCISVSPVVAASFGVPCTAGKVTRDGATKIWQMTQKLQGGSTNPELLRRD